MPSAVKFHNENQTESENEDDSIELKKSNQVSTYQSNESRLVSKVNNKNYYLSVKY